LSDGLSGKSGGLQSEEFADASSSEGDDSACDRLLEEFARTELATDAVSLPSLGTVVAEKYRIVSMLGRGGMGAVFKVRHEITRKVFALKWMLPGLSRNADAVQRFLLEASTSGRVVHRNLVDIYDVGEQGGSHYMVMEFVDGETLAQRLAAQSQLGVSEVCRVLIGVMRGLAAAHQAGLIQRDLKTPKHYFVPH
jgi:serine/threonine-protein kinase